MAVLRGDRELEPSPNLVIIIGQLNRAIGLSSSDPGEFPGVIIGLEIGEFQAACRRNDDDPLVPLDFATLGQFDERGEGDPRVRTREHPGPVRSSNRVGQFLFARLLHESVTPLKCSNRLLN